MRSAKRGLLVALVCFVAFLSTGRSVMSNGPAVQAVTIGPLTWKYSGYCNRLTLVIRDEGSGGLSRVIGTDDRCGASQYGAVSGSLHLNPDGSAGMGTNTYFPSGFTLSESCALNVNTGSGTCLDANGATNTITFGAFTDADRRLPARERR